MADTADKADTRRRPDAAPTRSRRSDLSPRQRRRARRAAAGASVPAVEDTLGAVDPDALADPDVDPVVLAVDPDVLGTDVDPVMLADLEPFDAPVAVAELEPSGDDQVVPVSVAELEPSGDDQAASPVARRRADRDAPHGVRARRRQRALRVRLVVGVLVLAAIGLVVVAVVTGAVDRALELLTPGDAGAPADADAGDPQPMLVVVTYDETDPSGLASAVTMLAVDRATGAGTVLLVPSAMLVDVPGHGTFSLREAFSFGGGGLVAASLDNLLGVRSDGVAAIAARGWAELLAPVGGIEVQVRSRLLAPGGEQVRFEAGPQSLDGDRLADYLVLRQDGETELEALPRVQHVLVGLLDAIIEDAALLDAIVENGTPLLDGVDPQLVVDVLDGLAAARGADRLTTITLPVQARGSGREDLYSLDSARATELVDELLAASRPVDGIGVGRDLQVLNGNGVPGMGELVAERLLGGGYRILLTGNAQHFDHPVTRIVVHADDEDQLAAAEDIRERLGVGVVERSGIPQSVGDITIIVGADFP